MRRFLILFAGLLFLVWFATFRPLALGGPASYIIVSGRSMEPALYTNDLAVLQRRAAYQPGDIIAFQVPGGSVIHRLVGGSAEAGYITQGDNKRNVDPWQPKAAQVLGKLWFHIPGAGKYLTNLRSPTGVILLVGLAALLFLEEPGKDQNKSKRGKRMRSGSKFSLVDYGTSETVLTLFGIALILALVFLAALAYGYSQPLQVAQTSEVSLYEHKAAFQYTIHTGRSLLYPNQVIGPVRAGGSPGEPAAPQPVLTGLARSLDLDFAYLLVTGAPVQVSGQVSALMEIRAGETWKKSEPLLAPVAFSGNGTISSVTLDFERVSSFIAQVEEETGYRPSRYDIAIIPTFEISGTVAGRPVDGSYSPAFVLAYDEDTITPDAELARIEAVTISEEVMTPNAIGLLGWSIPVETLRSWGLTGFLIGLALTLGLGAVIAAALITDESARFRLRYNSPVVSVAEADLDSGPRIRVASMADLARLAHRYGQVVFRIPHEDGWVYFVPDGTVTYTYPVKAEGPAE